MTEQRKIRGFCWLRNRRDQSPAQRREVTEACSLKKSQEGMPGPVEVSGVGLGGQVLEARNEVK